MNDEKIQAIGKALRTDGKRQKAVGLVDKIDTLPKRLAEAWADDLAYALESEQTPYTQAKVVAQLEKVARDHPEAALVTVPALARAVGGGLHDLSSSGMNESTTVNRGTDALQLIVSGVDESDRRIEITHTDVEEILQHGDAAQRSLGYRLLGWCAEPDAVRALTANIDHEVESVRASRREAVDDALGVVERSIRGNGDLSPKEAYLSLSELYSFDDIDVDRSVLEQARDVLFDELTNTDSEPDELLRATGRLAREDAEFAQSLVSESIRSLTESSEDPRVGWDVLRAVAKWEPESVVGRSDDLVAVLATSQPEEKRRALRVLSTVAERTRSVPTDLAEVAVRELNADEEEVVLEAIRAVEQIGFHPPPQELVRLSKGRGRAASAAEEAMETLLDDRRGNASSYARDLESDDREVALFAEDEGDLRLKQRTDDGMWGDVDVGTVRNDVVRETISSVDKGENTPIVLPHYEPRDVVLVAISLVLDAERTDRRIAIYSPGSQSHWGMKGQVREELGNFGLSDTRGRVVDAEPIPDVIPDSYVWKGEVKNNSEGEAPGEFLLCKKLSDLDHVDDLDVVLLNHSSRIPDGTEENIREVESVHPDSLLVNAYSYYAKNERDGRPRYGPPRGLESTSTVPSVKAIDAAIEEGTFDWDTHLSAPYQSEEDSLSDSYETSIGTWTLGDDDVRSLATPSDVRIRHVEAGDVSALLDQVFESSSSLRNVDDYGSGGLIFSRQLFFERLSVPGEDFDQWVRERYYEGDRFVPPLIEERIEDVERKAGTVEALEAVQPLNKAQRLLERIAEELQTRNPLFDEIQNQISTARENDERLAIFSGSVKHAQILRHSLKKHDVVTQTEMDGGAISVVSPDEARSLGVYDRLVVPGALHQENAGFYVHPRVSETVVLTYDRAWASMIERHACDFVDSLNAAVGGLDYAPYAYPEIGGDLPVEETEEEDEVSPGEDGETTLDQFASEFPETITASSGSVSDGRSKADILADAMDHVSGREYSEESGRYDREIRHYAIETTDGEVLDLTNHDRILRKRRTNGKVEHHWVNPEALTVGDSIVTIPSEVKTKIWQEQLEKLYEDELEADEAVERLGQWYDAVEAIWKRVSDENTVTGDDSTWGIHSTIYDTINQTVPEFDRERSTVRSWFDSVLDAEAPIDLVEDPSLIIGPRSYEDIEAIGRAFDYELLVSDAEEIGASMEGLRTINRQQGHELHEEIRDQMNTHESNRVLNAARRHEVANIEEKTEDAEENSSTGS